MNMQTATNRKCPYQFNQATQELNYCITDLCMSWNGDDQMGYCILFACKCKHEKKDTE
jgi:hypothetical protein